MELKLTIPEDISDITLTQYQRDEKLKARLKDEDLTVREYNKRKLDLFAGVPYHRVDEISQKDLEDILNLIDSSLEQDCEFVKRFFIDGVEFGFIPNFDEINSAEWFDLNKHEGDVDTLHNLMAVLFRPITSKDKSGNYEIETYNGTNKYSEVMKHTPMNIVNGALVFFFNLSSELESHILKYTKEVQEKEKERQTILQNGGGTVPSMN